ncbi:MAG: hypothetical protein ACXWP4_00260 [Polyangiales bacterium]
MSERKPLEPVRVVRAHAVDAEAARVRGATEALGSAQREADVARSAALALRADLAAQIAKERASITNPRDHALLEAFRSLADRRIADAEAKAAAALETMREAERALAERTRALADARASLDIVEKHQERAREAIDRDVQERIDEAAEEGFAARHGTRTAK